MMDAPATTPRQAAALLPELTHEITLTRRVLERLPDGQLDYRPHPKSMTLGQLATHTADMLQFMAMTLQTPEVDLATMGGDWAPAATPADLLARLDAGAAAVTAALQDASNEAFAETWALRQGEQVLTSQPRAAVIRHLISHTAHHRGQLLVYLRLLDVPVPGIYGPSADEK